MDLERVKGIEPSYAAWEAAVLPLNYTRGAVGNLSVRSAVGRKREVQIAFQKNGRIMDGRIIFTAVKFSLSSSPECG